MKMYNEIMFPSDTLDILDDVLNIILGDGEDFHSAFTEKAKCDKTCGCKEKAKEKITIKNVIFNNPATIVIWSDDVKTVVKCQKGDTYDKEKGLMACIAKRAYGNTSAYNDVINEFCK